MPLISPGRYREPVSITKPGSSIVVFSNVDGVLRAPHTQAFTTAAAVLKQLSFDDTALVLCSGKTRAELECVQQRLVITQPFICENGGAVIIPNGYFDLMSRIAVASQGARQSNSAGRMPMSSTCCTGRRTFVCRD